MNAKKCDRCGKYFNEDEKYYEIHVKPCIDRTTVMLGNYYDFCDECSKKFDKFVKEQRYENFKSEEV